MLVKTDIRMVTSTDSDKVVASVRATKVTMRWRWVLSSQSSRNLKAPSRSCTVTNGMSNRHACRHRS